MQSLQFDLPAFVAESNRIEGIYETRKSDLLAHAAFLKLMPSVESLSGLVYNIAGSLLRDRSGMNVRVGDHIAPRGGADVKVRLKEIIYDLGTEHPVVTHQKYLSLHPFMDGNGRSARALWLKNMIDSKNLAMVCQYGFLISFYYQTLALGDKTLG